jgi:hypothetical protein
MAELLAVLGAFVFFVATLIYAIPLIRGDAASAMTAGSGAPRSDAEPVVVDVGAHDPFGVLPPTLDLTIYRAGGTG